MSEFIVIQVGQCGNQIGSAFWPSVLEEHGFLHDITSTQKYNLSPKKKLNDALHSFFWSPNGIPNDCQTLYDLQKSKTKARAVLVDMEESVVGRYDRGPLRNLFDKTCSLTNHPGSGNNWAIGHYLHARDHNEKFIDILRRSAERCDFLHGFLLMFSLGGGTGSGLGTAIVNLVQDEFPLVDRLITCVHPGIYNDVVTSPYNIGLSLQKLSEHATCVFPIDNKALGDICLRLKPTKDMVNWKPYKDMNSIIVKMLLNLTSGSRFPGPLNLDMNELATNLVPRPRLHYLSCSLSPLHFGCSKDVGYRPRDLFVEVCSRDNQLDRINSLSGTILSSALICRGDVPLFTCRDYVNRFQAKFKFVGWNKTGIKTSLCSIPAAGVSSSLLSLTNSSNMSSLFQDALHHFNLLYRRKAHVHHYTNVDGFESSDFDVAKESMLDSIQRYNEASHVINIPRLKLL
uniref:Tubulin/FtsZ GTPase domain-containing protein n=1 Tax=Clastoptera arizonana TaxID=38151 RepID=A0A1B6D8E1_9HEMI